MCVCVCAWKIVDFGKSDKMLKISRKANKSSTYNGFSNELKANNSLVTLF